MIDKYLYTLVALSATDIVGHVRFTKIKQTFPDISDFLDCPIDDQMHLLDAKSDRSKKILINLKKIADFVIRQCQLQNISLIAIDDPLYPKLLREIDDPPYLLYSRGNLVPQIPLIAVIGTRKYTPDSEHINRHFCKQFVEYGIGVVSGLAAGHDAIAADSVLKNDGYTVGVLGTPIDTVYPKSSERLYYQIMEKGALISEYPPGMTSGRWHFPRRNRIVSGMSQAVCVIQAPEKSGTMITVEMAIEQQKEVYAIPGNPLVPQYDGCNLLISKGAKIALNPKVIIDDVLSSYPNIEVKQFIHQTPTPKPTKILPDLTPEEQKILSLADQHIHIDEILRELDIDISALNSILTMMEIKGLIIQKPGQLYIKC